MSNFEKFKEELPSKKKFYILLTRKRISDEEYELVLNPNKAGLFDGSFSWGWG